MAANITIEGRDVLLVVDVQNDFCPGGSLAVPNGHQVVPLINRLAPGSRTSMLTQDWHPRGHQSFASAHPGRKPFDTIAVAYGPQVLWPDHCVQGTSGAEFHAGPRIPHAELVLRKGYPPRNRLLLGLLRERPHDADGLASYLRERGLARVFLAGLAFDFCVRYSAEDARREGFDVVVIEDACRGIDLSGSLADTHRSLAALNIPCVSQADVVPAQA